MENTEAKENFDNAKNFISKNPPNKEKAKEYFLKYLDCISSEFDEKPTTIDDLGGNIIKYEKVGDVYAEASDKDSSLKEEANKYYKITFDICYKNKDHVSLGDIYSKHLADLYLKAKGVEFSPRIALNHLQSFYDSIDIYDPKYGYKKKFPLLLKMANIYLEEQYGIENFEKAEECLTVALRLKPNSGRVKSLIKTASSKSRLKKSYIKKGIKGGTLREKMKNNESQTIPKAINSNELKNKPDYLKKGFSGEELEYINGILIEYFEQHKGWFGGYKPANYHDLAMYLFGRQSEEMRKGNKVAGLVHWKIPPMGIPQEIFGYYNKLYSIEQDGFDPIGTNTRVMLKKNIRLR